MVELPEWCTDPQCFHNQRGIQHTCDQCSELAITKCACWKEHLKSKQYTAANVQAAVEADLDVLFAPHMVGQHEGYTPEPNTKRFVALSYWLSQELTKIAANEVDRRTQEWKYNRLSRSYDIWETAAECLNDMLEDKVEQNRIGHRR